MARVGAGVVVREDDEIVAYFGGMERRILFNGVPVTAFQSGDSMVAREHRGTLSKRGPFFLSVAAFQDRYLGNGRPYLISYGFPNERAMRLAERLGMYTQIGALFEIYWPADASVNFRSVPFDFDDDKHRNALWKRCGMQWRRNSIEEQLGCGILNTSLIAIGIIRCSPTSFIWFLTAVISARHCSSEKSRASLGTSRFRGTAGRV